MNEEKVKKVLGNKIAITYKLFSGKGRMALATDLGSY
jgi:hypothetical protein